ncbi:hypothetical protein PAMP_004321 [Pampus punctatissimus]
MFAHLTTVAFKLANAVSEHIQCEETETAVACYEELVLKVEKVQDLLAEFDKQRQTDFYLLATIHGPCVYSPGIHAGTEELERHVHDYDQQIVISGGFNDPEKVASAADTDVSQLQAIHEEADTRILLHAADATAKGYQRLIIHCRDTDVLVLLLVFAQHLSSEIWIKAGTVKKPCYIKVNNIKH